MLLPMKCCDGQLDGLCTKTLLDLNVGRLEVVFVEVAKNPPHCETK